MTLYERVQMCAKEAKISIPMLEKTCNLGNGTIGKWKESMPKADKLYDVARYFGKTVEYFLTENNGVGRNNSNILTNSINESPNATLQINSGDLSKQESELIEIYRNMSLLQQLDLITYALKIKNGDK